MEHQESTASAGPITTFYNRDCPVCRMEIDHYRALDERLSLGLGWRDIAAEPDALIAFGIDGEAAKRRLYVLDDHGRLHGGVDAFLLIWQRIPRYRWLARLVGARGVKPVAALIYDRLLAPVLVAFNRVRRLAHWSVRR